jgi:hypothetical protein
MARWDNSELRSRTPARHDSSRNGCRALFTELGEFFVKAKLDRDALNDFGKPWGVEFLGPPLSPHAR